MNANEVLSGLIADEIAAHGCVRPPWVRLPDVHPLDIAWRMGAGETHLMTWSAWSEHHEQAARVEALRRHGPVPADWAWWAANALALVSDEDDLYELPFAEVRRALESVGLSVFGEPT